MNNMIEIPLDLPDVKLEQAEPNQAGDFRYQSATDPVIAALYQMNSQIIRAI